MADRDAARELAERINSEMFAGSLDDADVDRMGGMIREAVAPLVKAAMRVDDLAAELEAAEIPLTPVFIDLREALAPLEDQMKQAKPKPPKRSIHCGVFNKRGLLQVFGDTKRACVDVAYTDETVSRFIVTPIATGRRAKP